MSCADDASAEALAHLEPIGRISAFVDYLIAALHETGPPPSMSTQGYRM